MFAQREAIIRLLNDEDEATVEMVKQQLVSCGRSAIPDLLDLQSCTDAGVVRHVADILGRIDAAEAQVELGRLCQKFPDGEGLAILETASFLMARALSPGCDADGTRHLLDEWGRELAVRAARVRSGSDRVMLLGDFFGRELGFRGDSERYYVESNSLLPEVIVTRRGIPISLAAIYLFVGQRAGLSIEGVNFPGHFLIRFEEVLLDPFEGGRVHTLGDCATLLMRQNLRAEASYFEPASPRVMLRRMMANLLYLYQRSDSERAALVAGWMEDLDQ